MAKFTTKGKSLYIDGKKVKKGWESFNGMYWFATKLDRRQDSVINGKVYKNDILWYGFVQGQYEEWGTFSDTELKLMKYKVWRIPQRNLLWSGRRN
jgi:hypothetical protein